MSKSRIADLRIDQGKVRQVVSSSPALRAEMQRRLSSALAFAQEIAPDEIPIGEGYVAGLGWVILERNGELRGYLYSRDPKTFWIEFGTQAAEQHAATPAYHVLARALDRLR